MRWTRRLAIGLVCALLGACAGGGDAGGTAGTAVTPTTAPVVTSTAERPTTAADPTTTTRAPTTTVPAPTTVPVTYDGPGPIIWAAGDAAGAVFRIDADSGEFDTIEVGGRPQRILYAEGAVWVTDCVHNTVYRIEPVAPFAVEAIRAGACPYRLAAYEGHLLVTNAVAEGALTVLRAADGAVLGRMPIGEYPTGVALIETPVVSSWRQAPAALGAFVLIALSSGRLSVVRWDDLQASLQIGSTPVSGCQLPFGPGADDSTQRDALQAADAARNAALDQLAAARDRAVAAAEQTNAATAKAEAAHQDGDAAGAGEWADEAQRQEAAALAAWKDAEAAYEEFDQAQCLYGTTTRVHSQMYGAITDAPSGNNAVSREAEEAYRTAFAAARSADFAAAHARAAAEGTVGPWDKQFDPVPELGANTSEYPGPDGAEGVVGYGSQTLVYSGSGEVWQFDAVLGPLDIGLSTGTNLRDGASDGRQAVFTDGSTVWHFDGAQLQPHNSLQGVRALALFFGHAFGGTESGEIVRLADGSPAAHVGSPVSGISTQLPSFAGFSPSMCPGADPVFDLIGNGPTVLPQTTPGLGSVCPDGTLASHLGRSDPAQPYHPLHNGLVFTCGCP